MPIVVGRDREFGTVAEVMGRRQPAFVCVVADAAMGKTTFLSEVQLRARHEGWTTVGVPGGEELQVEASTTIDGFSAEIRGQLRATDSRAFFDASPAPTTGGIFSTSPGSQRSTGTDGSPRFLTGSESLVREFYQRQPVLALIDGYRPSSEFHAWFSSSFVPQLLGSSDLHTVLAVAGSRNEVEPLLEIGGIEIELAQLSEDDVLEHLERLGQGMHPPLGDEEARNYASVVARRPDLLGSLSRLLQLAASDKMGSDAFEGPE